MDPVVIFRHVDCEGPGYLAEVLAHRRIPFEMVRVDAGEAVPARPRAAGLVFMGGPMSVNDDLPWIEPELALIRRAVEAGTPVLGHCLGGQLIARALGAEVGPNPVKEIGWLPVATVEGAADAPWIAGVAPELSAFHWHGETFSLPAGATHLFASDHCPNQGFAVGSGVLALQFHVEMTVELVREWVARYGEELAGAAGSPAVQPPERILEDLDRRVGTLHEVADVLYDRWLAAVVGGR